MEEPRREHLEDLIGGRFLAWTGGASVLTGLVLLLGLAISRGWIGPAGRTVLAGMASLSLALLGAWLHERRGRTDAALAATAVGAVGLFVTDVIATAGYALISPGAGLVLAALAGAGTVVLSVRWRSSSLAGVGLGGALLAPVLVGAHPSWLVIGFLLLAASAAAVVLVAEQWSGLAIGGFIVTTLQWVAWLVGWHHGVVASVATLAGFGALGIASAAGFELRSRADRLRPSAAALLALNAVVLATVGWVVLPTGRAGWLLALAGAHAAAGLALRRRSPDFGLIALMLALVTGDVAATALIHGPALGVVWAAGAVGLAAIRRGVPGRHETVAAEVGLAGHVGLVLLHLALVELPGDAAGLGSTVVLGGLIAACFASARLAGEQLLLRDVLDSLGLVAAAVLTALQLDGTALAGAWGAEAVALARIANVRRDKLALAGMAAFLLLALAWAVAAFAPPVAVVTGAHDGGGALLALGVVIAAAAACAWACEGRTRVALAGLGAVAGLYLASVELVGAFQPGLGVDGLLGLEVRQQGQLLLSLLWALVGAIGVVVGLRRRVAPLRYVSLGLLGLAAAKVFAYDLAALESLYRVTSFVALGVLLLAAAFAYQRLRPRAPEDMRKVPAAFR
jgi:uncharacterized membrane protein